MDFCNKMLCRLTYPSKSDIAKTSKQILDKINLKLISDNEVNQRKNSASIIEWFNNIPNKDQHRFVVFYIKSFYPSTSEDLFNEALNFAKPRWISPTKKCQLICNLVTPYYLIKTSLG